MHLNRTGWAVCYCILTLLVSVQHSLGQDTTTPCGRNHQNTMRAFDILNDRLTEYFNIKLPALLEDKVNNIIEIHISRVMERMDTIDDDVIQLKNQHKLMEERIKSVDSNSKEVKNYLEDIDEKCIGALYTTSVLPQLSTASAPTTTTQSPITADIMIDYSTTLPADKPLETTSAPTNFRGDCPVSEGFLLSPDGTECFLVHGEEKRTWPAADSFCKSEGMMLAEPADRNAPWLQKTLNEKYDGGDTPWYFVGARGSGSGSSRYMWQQQQQQQQQGGGGEVNSSLWVRGAPRFSGTTNTCVAMDTRDDHMRDQPGRPYFDGACYNPRYYICQKYKV